ncbi:MAG: type II toxin-antitoxin system HicA family toxin [Ruminococcus sp.]|nr:type II toxin-antitoxin system HicA family toxin [Ruminococcus sp.]
MSNRKSYSSTEILKILRKDGWYEMHCVGDHHQYKHPTKKGKVTGRSSHEERGLKYASLER